MSFCQEKGKDRVIFLTREDFEKPSSVILPRHSGEEEPGPLLPNGDINWSCPCISIGVSSPCGVEFREMHSCFVYSKDESPDDRTEKCKEQFSGFINCLMQNSEALLDEEEDDKDTEGVTNDATGEDSASRDNSQLQTTDVGS